MAPVGRPYPKGTSGNPGGRKAMPREIRDALLKEAPDSVRRVIELSKMTELIANPKTLPIYLAANIRVQTLAWGKDPIVVEVDGNAVTLQPVDLSHYTDDDLAAMERIERDAEQRRLAAEADAGGHPGGEEEENAGAV